MEGEVSELAERRMSLDEFLRWDDGTDTRYELVDGFPVAMAPPAEAHRILAMRLGLRIDTALQNRRPCNVQIEAGVLRPDRADLYYVADLAVTCRPNEPGRQAIVDPILIVEILSPSTERHDRRIKLPVYRQIESVAGDPADRRRRPLCRSASPRKRSMGNRAGARLLGDTVSGVGGASGIDGRTLRGRRHLGHGFLIA